MVLAGVLMAGFAKTQNFPELEGRLGRGELLNLNTIQEPDQLLTFLNVFPPEQRQAAAERIWTAIQPPRRLPDVGALARIPATRPAFSKLHASVGVFPSPAFCETSSL